MAKLERKGTKTADPAAPAFFLHMLGHLALNDASGQMVKLRTRKALLLLACLAADADQLWSRERLAGSAVGRSPG